MVMDKHTKKFERPKKAKPEFCRTCKKPNKSYCTKDNGRGTRYYELDCTDCKAQKRNKWIKRIREDDPERYYRIRRHQQLRRDYKISLEEYENLHRKQNGLCAICLQAVDTKAMAVDHDHVTGTIRGLLCHWCNKGLGQFKDDPVVLERAVGYLNGRSIPISSS